MSRARHKEHEKKRADGGRLSSEPKWNAGGEQNAAKEAEERKKGGRVKHHEAEGEEGVSAKRVYTPEQIRERRAASKRRYAQSIKGRAVRPGRGRGGGLGQ